MKPPIKARNFRYSFDTATGRYTGLIRKKPDQVEWPSNSTDIAPPWPGDPQVPHWDFANHVWTTKARDVSETEQNILFAHERAMKPSFQLLTSAVDDLIEAQINLGSILKQRDEFIVERLNIHQIRADHRWNEFLRWESETDRRSENLAEILMDIQADLDHIKERLIRPSLFARFWRCTLAALGMRR